MTLLHITQQKLLQCVVNILYIKHEWIHDQGLCIFIVIKNCYLQLLQYSVIVSYCHGNILVK